MVLGWIFFFFFQGRLMISGGCGASWVEAAAANLRWAGPDDNDTDRLMFHRACVCVECLSWDSLCCRRQRWAGRVQLAADHRAHNRPEKPSGPGQVAQVKTLSWKNSGFSNWFKRSAHVDSFSIFQLQGLFMKLKDGRTKYNGTAAASGFPLN